MENFENFEIKEKPSILTFQIEITYIEAKGEIPSPRAFFSAVLIGNDRILIHGGCDDDNEYGDSSFLDLSNIYRNSSSSPYYIYHISFALILESFSWKNFKIPSFDCTLIGHKMVNLSSNADPASKRNILIFGGWDGSNYCDASYLLNYEKCIIKKSYYQGWMNNSSCYFFLNFEIIN